MAMTGVLDSSRVSP